MPSGVSVTNQQPQQLGLGFPAPPGDPPGEYRTIKERRLLFGRSKGYRDLTLAGTEPESPGDRSRSVRKSNNPVPPSPRTTTLYAFGSSNSTTQLVAPRESPTKLSRSGSFNMPFRSSESLSSSTTVSRGGRSIAAPPSPTPNLGEFGHKLSMSTSFQSPTKRPTPHKRTGTTSSITVGTMGPPPATERAGKLTPATPTANRHKPSIEKLPLSPTSAKNKLSVSTKDISHSRRGSLIPGASGLGARTISPTDASRLARRLSQPPPTNHTIIVSEDEPLPTLTASTFEKKFAAPMNTTRLPTLKSSNPPSRTPSPSPPSNRDSLRDSGIGSSASGTISSGHPSPNTVFLEAAKSSRRKSLVVVAGQNGVPPVPPIPKDISEKNITAKVGSVKTSPKNTNSPRGSPKPSPRYKSPPPPLPSQSVPKTPPISSLRSRDHGLTLSTSIPSYVNTKAQTARETSSRTTTIHRQLEPSNLPPFKVSALATPTVQRVNALVAKNSTPASTGKSTPPQRTVTTPQTAVTTRFPRGPRTPATPSLTPPIIHPSGVKTASAAPSRRSIPSPGSLLIANRKASFIEKHVSNSSLQNQVTKLPAHEEEKESPKSVWRSVSRGTGKLVRRSSVTDKKIGTPRKKEEKEKEDALAMPAPTLVPKRNMFGLARKGPTAAAKDMSDRNTALTGSLSMTRQSSSTSTATATPPPPRYSPNSSNPSTDDELLGGNSRAMEIILRSASSKYRNKIERDLEELESVRRRVVEFGDAGMKDPVTPVTAVKIWGRGMSTFEKGEVVDYPNVWYCSDSSVSKTGRGDPTALSASKTPENATSIGVANFGFDDEIGNYVIVQGDHLAYRYEITGMLGKGSFGQVCKCVDHKTGKVVAVKIIRNKQRFHTQALVEVNILQKLCQWDADDEYHLIRVTHHFYFRGHLCIATELLGMNLYELIKTNEFRGFPLTLIRKFARQMLRCLLFLRKQRVVHCDLKPENILLVHPLKSEIKIIDFGSSCFENEKVYTYIQSRFYRSPEVILGMTYGMAIDMWSVGCILAELYTGYPLFPGENEQEQLACIMEVFGPPEKYLVEKSARKKLFFDSNGKPKPVVSSKGKRRRPSTKTLAQSLNCGDEAFVDFIARCMRWSPDARMTPEEALLHPFIDDVVPKVLEKRSSGQGKSMLPTPSTFNGRTKSMGETTSDRRKRSQTGNSTGGMAFSTSLPSFSQSQSHPRPLPEIPKLTSSSSMKRRHRLSASISSSISSVRAPEIQTFGSTKAEAGKSGLGIFTGPRRSTINSSNGSLSMKSSRENTSLVGTRF